MPLWPQCSQLSLSLQLYILLNFCSAYYCHHNNKFFYWLSISKLHQRLPSFLMLLTSFPRSRFFFILYKGTWILLRCLFTHVYNECICHLLWLVSMPSQHTCTTIFAAQRHAPSFSFLAALETLCTLSHRPESPCASLFLLISSLVNQVALVSSMFNNTHWSCPCEFA